MLDSQRSHDTEIDMMALLRQRVDGILLATTGGYKWSAENAAARRRSPRVRRSTTRFNLLDFAGLFSGTGTAIEPRRSYALRLTSTC